MSSPSPQAMSAEINDYLRKAGVAVATSTAQKSIQLNVDSQTGHIMRASAGRSLLLNLMEVGEVHLTSDGVRFVGLNGNDILTVEKQKLPAPVIANHAVGRAIGRVPTVTSQKENTMTTPSSVEEVRRELDQYLHRSSAAPATSPSPEAGRPARASEQAQKSLHLIVDPDTGRILHASAGGKLLLEVREVHINAGGVKVLDLKGNNILSVTSGIEQGGGVADGLPADQEDAPMTAQAVSQAVGQISAFFDRDGGDSQ